MSSPPAQAQLVTVPTADCYSSSSINYISVILTCLDIDGHGLRIVTPHSLGPNHLQILHPNSEMIQR